LVCQNLQIKPVNNPGKNEKTWTRPGLGRDNQGGMPADGQRDGLGHLKEKVRKRKRECRERRREKNRGKPSKKSTFEEVDRTVHDDGRAR